MGLWPRIRESFWFVPAAMCVVAAGLAEVLVTVDRVVDPAGRGPLDVIFYRVGADGSRDVLGAIAGSMLTVASTTFSITIAVLAVTSSTYGPRLVRNFMADRANQFVLGVYVATFLYALLVLRSIRTLDGAEDNGVFVPHIAVNVAVLLAVLSIGVLVYFIHHISESIQVSTLSNRVRGELARAVDRLYPQTLGHDERDVAGQVDHERHHGTGAVVRTGRCGYVVGIDEERLLSLAVKHDVVVGLEVRPGSYCIDEKPVATVWPTSAPDDVLDQVRGCLDLDDSRTPHQDVEFATQQLVEMAVRALSPSMNDPYTAINALDDLSGPLAALAARRQPTTTRLDDDGNPRVLAPAVDVVDLLDMVFDAVRTYALAHPIVLHRAAEVADRVGGQADEQVRRRLVEQLDLMVAGYAATEPPGLDLDRVRSQVAATTDRLSSSAAAPGRQG